MARAFPDGYEGNPYYNPDDCGLEIVDQIELEESCYSFDTLCVWRDIETGGIFWGHDSGCSCPTPFEDFRSLDDLRRVDLDDPDWRGMFARAMVYDQSAAMQFERKVKDALEARHG